MNDRSKLRFVEKIANEKIVERADVHRHSSGAPTWRLMYINALYQGVAYKTERARVTEDLNKKLDDILDAGNYLKFIAVRIMEELEVKNTHGE